MNQPDLLLVDGSEVLQRDPHLANYPTYQESGFYYSSGSSGSSPENEGGHVGVNIALAIAMAIMLMIIENKGYLGTYVVMGYKIQWFNTPYSYCTQSRGILNSPISELRVDHQFRILRKSKVAIRLGPRY